MIGVIGGTGLYKMEGLDVTETRAVKTPFGIPSAPVTIGKLKGHPVAFLPRHGAGHTITPSEIDFRSNIWALKSVGVRRVLSVSATGSLVHEIAPGDLALPSQYFDWTRGKRAGTFFGEGVVAHISTAEPACATLRARVMSAAKELGQKVHDERTYACVEGPRLGTRAESFFLKGAGCHLVGMSNLPEAFLAREAQLCYATIAVATDYDCWLDDPTAHVTVDKVMALYAASIGRVKALLEHVIARDKDAPDCPCRKALEFAVLTPEEHLPAAKREMIAFLKA